MRGATSLYRLGPRTLLPLLIGIVVAWGVIGRPTAAFAHKVYVYAWVEGGKVYTESYFSSGDRVRKGLIQVYGPEGKKLVEGLTNDKGEFSFPIPQKTDLRIVLNAEMGHRGEFLLKAEDLGVSSSKERGIGTEAKEEQGQTRRVKPGKISTVSEQEIRTIVEQVLDSRLKPIARSIALLREEKGPGVTEVVGGIGYIVGLMGIVLYFKSRKRGN